VLFDLGEVANWVRSRFSTNYAPISVVSGGVLLADGDLIITDQTLNAFGHVRLTGIRDWLVAALDDRTGKEFRTYVLDHIRRSGAQTARSTASWRPASVCTP
jgi:hypothetical protein